LKTIAMVALFAAGVVIAQDTSGVKPKSTASKKSAARRRKSNGSASAKPAAAAPATAPSPNNTAARRRVSKSSPKTAAKSGKSKTALAAAHHPAQQQPTAERYKEIQQALAEHGYFNGTVDGAWGADSVDALKHFQRDQNLTDDGKLGSLSLIALGLGPKRTEAPPEKASQQ
jgi:peptidoglycan hydrolase-like protein with peptidoglycan-binding domain